MCPRAGPGWRARAGWSGASTRRTTVWPRRRWPGSSRRRRRRPSARRPSTPSRTSPLRWRRPASWRSTGPGSASTRSTSARLPPVPDVPGYTIRAVRDDEWDARAECHRRSWSDTSKVSGAAYRRLMATPPYRAALDRVAVTADGEMVASCCVWLDDASGIALVEPVGCRPEHRRHGLASAVSLAALHAARDLGATTGLVRPRGDDDYPEPGRRLPRSRLRPRPAYPQLGTRSLKASRAASKEFATCLDDLGPVVR